MKNKILRLSISTLCDSVSQHRTDDDKQRRHCPIAHAWMRQSRMKTSFVALPSPAKRVRPTRARSERYSAAPGSVRTGLRSAGGSGRRRSFLCNSCQIKYAQNVVFVENNMFGSLSFTTSVKRASSSKLLTAKERDRRKGLVFGEAQKSRSNFAIYEFKV